MSLANRFKNLFNFCPYIIFVADAADIVRGAKLFMWSNFASHENCWWSKFHITSKLAPHVNCLSCGVIWLCGSTTNCSLYQTLLNVTNLQCMLSWRDLRCFGAKSILSRFTYFCVEQKRTQKSCPWSKNDKYDVWIKLTLEKTLQNNNNISHKISVCQKICDLFCISGGFFEHPKGAKDKVKQGRRAQKPKPAQMAAN